MEEIKFTPYLKENIYRQIRERTKKKVPFQGGQIGTIVGSSSLPTLQYPAISQLTQQDQLRMLVMGR